MSPNNTKGLVAPWARLSSVSHNTGHFVAIKWSLGKSVFSEEFQIAALCFYYTQPDLGGVRGGKTKPNKTAVSRAKVPIAFRGTQYSEREFPSSYFAGTPFVRVSVKTLGGAFNKYCEIYC